MEVTGLAARAAALRLVDGVLTDGRPLADLLLPDGPLQRETPDTRARGQRLALATLRNVDRADAVLKPFLRRNPIPPVRNALRLAVVEMLAEGAPAHGVVNATVALLGKSEKTSGHAGLANAVLRKAAEARDIWDRQPPQRLPGWLRGRLNSAWGNRATQAIEAAHAAGAPTDITLKGARPEGLAADALPTGSLRLSGTGALTAQPGYESGDWWVQDAAAALPARGLAIRDGEEVLDLCAAPGGKTLQLAAAGGRVTAVDISTPRLERLKQNLARTGLSATIVAADLEHWSPAAPVPAILLDAPCSATGTIRRHPDLPFVKCPDSLRPLIALQERLIDRALGWLAPGGRLVYCTCSLLPEEGEKQVVAAVSRHPSVRIEAAAWDFPGIPLGWRSPEGGLRIRPDDWAEIGGIDGFYMALLRRE